MRLSDYVIEYLSKNDVGHVFMLSGGGMMYLMDSLGRSDIEYVCCHHEQAAGIAAVGYALESNGLGVCMVTTGPGGTNALTATGAAYVDSTPVLFISGQVKTADFASKRHVRQYGAQENDIVSMARPVTKYAITVTDKNDIRYHLEKAVYLAMHGRRGPVWIDIPLDIQNSEIEPDILQKYDPSECLDEDIIVQNSPNIEAIDYVIDRLIKDLKSCRRPLILAGHGLKSSAAEQLIIDLSRKYNIPIQTTWRELALLSDDDELFFGSPGLQARRYSNLIIQGADLLIVLGSRLDNMITAFNEDHFAFRARKYVVDIDKSELNKYLMPDLSGVNCDIKEFLQRLAGRLDNVDISNDYSAWLRTCRRLRSEYPLLKEKQAKVLRGVDLYKFTNTISDYSTKDDAIVISSTSRCNTAGHIAFAHKTGQRIISSMGFGSMGFALPQVTGAWFASDVEPSNRRVIMIEGDGSLQLNIQELQTIVHHNINAKLFVFSNVGYAAIATMQDRNFGGFHVGSDADSGVTMPDLKKVSEAYGIYYRLVENDEQSDEAIQDIMNRKGPCLCEFRGSIEYDEIPKCISSLDANGNRVSAVLENPFPFLSNEEVEKIFTDMQL